jgi:hypothetical protein
MWRKAAPAGPVYVVVHLDDGSLAGFVVEKPCPLFKMACQISVSREPSEIQGLAQGIAADAMVCSVYIRRDAFKTFCMSESRLPACRCLCTISMRK